MKNLKVFIWIAFLSISVTALFSCSNDSTSLPANTTQGSSSGSGNSNNPLVGSKGEITLYRVSNGSITKIKDFQVRGIDLDYQNDVAKHYEIWSLIKKIVPPNQLARMSEFMIYNGGLTGCSGYIKKTSRDLSEWQLGIAINYAYEGGFNKDGELAYTIIHNYGHILTLNNTQIDVSIVQSSCENFSTREGCTNTNSYLNRLYDLYWEDIYNEHLSAQGNQTDRQGFFQKYEDRFVTNYASTSPSEDIAEVFAMFIAEKEKPIGTTIAAKKILLMYGESELTAFRDYVRQNFTSGMGTEEAFDLPIPGKWGLADTFGDPETTECRY